MLGLLSETPPSWLAVVEADLPRLLVDHAHCEIKAAQSALSLLARHAGEHPQLVEPLVDLAREEADHFQQVQALAQARGLRMPPPEPDPYVLALQRATKRDASSVPRLLDRLLVSALIEARSCERFRVLASGLRADELRAFYHDLMASEARHYRMFVRLAESIFGEAQTQSRLRTLLERERDIMADLGVSPTVHG